MGFGPLWKGVGLQREKGVPGYAVNRWSIKRPPNGTKLDRRSTGAIPRPLGKTRSIPRTFNTRSHRETEGKREEVKQELQRRSKESIALKKREKRETPEDIGAPDCKTDNGENARMHETNTYAK